MKFYPQKFKAIRESVKLTQPEVADWESALGFECSTPILIVEA